MLRILRWVGLAGVVLLVAAAVYLVPTIWGKPWRVQDYHTRVLVEFALEHPMLLSYARILEPWGIEFHSDELEDLSVEAQLRTADQVNRFLAGLRAYDRDTQPPALRLSSDVMEWFLQIQADRRPFLFHDYPVEQYSGWHTFLPDFMVNIHQVHSVRDADNYVARLRAFDAVVDQLIEGVRFRAERGVLPPRFVIERVRVQLADFVEPAPHEHILYTGLVEKLDAAEGIGPQDREAVLVATADAIGEEVLPAYRRLDAALAELQEVATSDDGVWKLPGGDDYYRWALRYHTTTNLSPDEVHAIGLREVARIRREMRTALSEAGEPADDPIGRLAELARDERFLFPDTEEGRAQILEGFRAIVSEAEGRLPDLFGRLPDARVLVERVPVFREQGAAGANYSPPSLDGTRPGTFFANLRSVAETQRFGMRTLAYHEAVPGHHLQIALAVEQTELPIFRRIIPFTAFIEGWALYAETLADEAGWHPTPYDRLGKLRAEIFRAVRLVVDTGIHWKRWTREEAIAYMLDNTGMTESDVIAEIERYIVVPGLACAYKIGQLEILRLREEARSALGPDFDLREFNDLVLGGGSMPLVVLDEVVGEWAGAGGG